MQRSISKIGVLLPTKTIANNISICAPMSQLGHLGSGAGRGGGGGGAIREAGGSFGLMEAAHEEEYFHKKQLEQLRALKTEQGSQKEFHETQIKELEAAVERHKQSLQMLKK